MLRFGQVTLEPFLAAWVGWSVRHARRVAGAAALITIALAYYTWTHLSINTDTDQMIDPDLPFRQVYEDFNQSFPQFADSFLMVVDAATPEEADAAARHLVAELHGRDELVMNAYAPGTGDFFEANGFLYLDLDELYALTDSLADAEPVLAGLALDPSLRGLSDVLVLALDDAADNRNPPRRLASVLASLTPSAEAAAAGGMRLLSWQELFQDKVADILEGRRRVVLVQPVLDFTSFQPAKAALAEARRLAAVAEAATPGLTVRLTGKMAISAEELKSVSRGAKISGIVSFFLVTLILGFGIRSLRLVMAALATLVIGLIWTASFALVAIGYFNVISIAFAVLFIGLGIDFAIHFVLRYREEIWAGHANDEALRRTARGVGLPLALSAPTTAIAFYAFAPTAYSGLAQLGIISGTGMFISLFTSLTILPALMTLMPLTPGQPEPPGKSGRAPASGNAGGIGAMIARHGKAFAAAGFIAGAVALSAVPGVSFDYDPIKLKDPETVSVQAFQDLLAHQNASPYAAQIVVANRAEAAALKTRLEALDGVSRVITLSTYVPGGQQEKLELLFDTSIFMTPVLAPLEPAAPPTSAERQAALQALVAGLAALEEGDVDAALLASARPLRRALLAVIAGGDAATARLEEGLLTLFPQVLNRIRRGLATSGVTLADLPGDIRARYQATDGRIRVEVFPEADLGDQAALTRFIDDVSALHAQVTGNAVQVKRAGEIVIEAMQQATASAALLIILFLLLLFRAARDVALILSPVMLAAAMTAAATVWLNIPFNFANVIVLPLLIGLGVDAGIHLVMRAREAEDANEAGRHILQTSTPRAVLLSALTTVGSFGSLALSNHRGTASMGELLTISVFLTLACTLLVLPGLIAWAGKEQSLAKDGELNK